MSIRLRHKPPPETEIKAEELACLVDERFAEFLAAMTAAGNPGNTHRTPSAAERPVRQRLVRRHTLDPRIASQRQR